MIKKSLFKIIGMHCTSCSITIDGDLEDTQGIKQARTSYAKAQTEVSYDSQKVTPIKIISIIKQSGYDAVLAEK